MANRTHGQTLDKTGKRTPEYKAWEAMKYRCLNPKAQDYENWGGRGIVVCTRWLKFENFFSDMGLRPLGPTRFTLDRLDNTDGYYPSNCRWATYYEQIHNQRKRRPYKRAPWSLEHRENMRLAKLKTKQCETI